VVSPFEASVVLAGEREYLRGLNRVDDPNAIDVRGHEARPHTEMMTSTAKSRRLSSLCSHSLHPKWELLHSSRISVSAPRITLDARYFLALPFAVALLPLALSSDLAFSSALALSSLRLSSLLPGSSTADFRVVVVEEPITTTAIVDEVAEPATTGALLVVVVLAVLVLASLGLPQSLLAAALRRLPFGCDATHAPWVSAFSQVIGRICTGFSVVEVVEDADDAMVLEGLVVDDCAFAVVDKPNREVAATLVMANRRIADFIWTPCFRGTVAPLTSIFRPSCLELVIASPFERW
jgi:hypothetical protein